MRRSLLLLGTLGLAGCGESVPSGNGSIDGNASAGPDTVTIGIVPVRIGELGPSFEACATNGTTRRLETGGRLPVRAAPFDNAAESGAIPAGARFFVCTRSIDQKWFGIVYDEAGALAERCGVSDPVSAKRNYSGPCRSGWVASAFVKLIAGNDTPPVANQTGASPAASAPPKGP